MRNSQKNIRCATLAALPFAFLPVPAAGAARTVVDRSPVTTRFDLRIGDYSAAVVGEDKWVRMSIEDEESLAVYRVKGLVSMQRLKARFGELGRIAMRFDPTGGVARRRPPRRCEGEPQIVRRGLFVGRLRFRGEGDYVRVNVRRVGGSVTGPKSWRCEVRRRDDASTEIPGLPFGLPVLSAFTPHSRVVFGALGSNKSEKDQSTVFAGGTVEKRGSMQVARAAFTEGEAGSFEFKGDLSEATVAPPRPFQGTGTFLRNADGSSSWSGDLSVVLPGAGLVSLVGPEFTVDLTRPKSLEEALDLFGVAGLLE